MSDDESIPDSVLSALEDDHSVVDEIIGDDDDLDDFDDKNRDLGVDFIQNTTELLEKLKKAELQNRMKLYNNLPLPECRALEHQFIAMIASTVIPDPIRPIDRKSEIKLSTRIFGDISGSGFYIDSVRPDKSLGLKEQKFKYKDNTWRMYLLSLKDSVQPVRMIIPSDTSISFFVDDGALTLAKIVNTNKIPSEEKVKAMGSAIKLVKERSKTIGRIMNVLDLGNFVYPDSSDYSKVQFANFHSLKGKKDVKDTIASWGRDELKPESFKRTTPGFIPLFDMNIKEITGDLIRFHKSDSIGNAIWQLDAFMNSCAVEPVLAILPGGDECIVCTPYLLTLEAFVESKQFNKLEDQHVVRFATKAAYTLRKNRHQRIKSLSDFSVILDFDETSVTEILIRERKGKEQAYSKSSDEEAVYEIFAKDKTFGKATYGVGTFKKWEKDQIWV